MNAQQKLIFKKLILDSFKFDQTTSEDVQDRLFHLYSKINKNSASSKPKNYCFFIGRGRSVNRSLFMSRHIMRKFARFGMIQGLTRDRC